MTKDEYSHLFKLLVVGSSGVGKTCLLLRYTESIYKETYGSTIGVDFKMKNIILDNETIKLQLWDTAGQERFRTITSSYYRNAHGIVLVFDLTDHDSFTDIKGWISEISSNTTTPVVILLLGNKSDEPTHQVTDSEVDNFILSQNNNKIKILGYKKVSAKSGVGVDDAFMEIADGIKKNIPKEKQKYIKKDIPPDVETNSWWCF